MTVKLLYPFSGVMGIFFPVGRLDQEGTCEFATITCLEKCCAIHHGHGTKIGFKRKKEAYDFFVSESENEIIRQLLSELALAKSNILTWFGSGDCPKSLKDKFVNIVHTLDSYGIIQTGFTRNKELWRSIVINASDKCRVLLTIENVESVNDLPELMQNNNQLPKYRMYSVPNYEKGAIEIVTVTIDKIRRSSGCGGGYYENHISKTEKVRSHLKLDCNVCYKNKRGCFTKL